jgi:hypothetical protein
MRQLLLLAAFLLWSASPALATACPQAGEPNVIVTMDTGPIQFDHSQRIPQLTQLAAEPLARQAITDKEHVPMGLTAAQAETRYKVEARISRLSDGTVCAALTDLTLQLRHAMTTVYIARELPAGSCIEREVKLHENRHVAVNNAILSEYQSRISGELRRSLRSIGALRINNPDMGIEAISQRVKPYIDAAVKNMNDERLRRQAQVDTPQEYERVSRSCNGEAQRYIPRH